MTTATKNRIAKNSHVHRDFVLVSPVLKGPDVRELQEGINSLVRHYGFDWRTTKEDGEYGRRTARSAFFASWLIGLDSDRLLAIRNKGRIAQPVQVLLRNPEKRSFQDREREDDRKPKRVKLRKAHDEGIPAATAFLRKYIGVNESPSSSNRGPFPINECQAYFGIGPVPWCGCLAGYAVKEIGGANTDTWFPFSGSIRQDAIAGRNNLHDVHPSEAREGDIATFFSGGDDHVGYVREASRSGMIFTIDGNTSSAVRSSDGGIIEAKTRSFAEVSCVARIEDWG